MKTIHERIVMRKFFQAFLLILTCLSRWQAFAVEPLNDQQVRAVREAIAPKIEEWKSQARTDWDAIAILNLAKQWPGIQSDAVNAANPLNYGLGHVYADAGCSSLKEFTARLTAGIMLGNGFKDGVVNIRLKPHELTIYRDAVRDLSQYFTSDPLSEAHFRTTGSAGSVRGHVDAVNSSFAPAGKTDPIALVIPAAPVTLVSTSPAGQAIAKRYEDSELNADHAIYPEIYEQTEIVIDGPPIGSIEAAVKYNNPAVVVFANTHSIHFGKRPNDGPLPNNQEVCIFRCTDLTDQLGAQKDSFWPFDQTGGVYASGINIVRTTGTTRASFRVAHPQGYPIGLIFSAAPSVAAPSATDAAFPEYKELINKIVEHQFIMAIINGHDTLITGNFGLGIFPNNGDVVADAYINCLRKFNKRIARVVFTYLEPESTNPRIAIFGKKMLAAKALIEQERDSES
jgi:hypothetical protein